MKYPQEFDDLPKHERKQKIKEWKSKQQRTKKLVTKLRKFGMGILVVVGLGGLVYLNLPGEALGDHHEIEGDSHVSGNVLYKTNPPTSGDHHADPVEWGVYTDDLEDERAVHSLEHGGIWISYKDIPENQVEILEKIGKGNKGSVVVSPRSQNDNPIAVASWGQLLTLDEVDEELIREFIKTNKNRAPENLAR